MCHQGTAQVHVSRQQKEEDAADEQWTHWLPAAERWPARVHKHKHTHLKDKTTPSKGQRFSRHLALLGRVPQLAPGKGKDKGCSPRKTEKP